MIDTRITVTKYPTLPWDAIAQAVLGKQYELSLILCADSLARKINKESRKKNYSPNVLSLPITETDGEIILNVRKAEREARSYKHSYAEHLLYLYIHGLLHLKGMDHGATMEKSERHFLKRFSRTQQHASHNHRN